jgi:anti-sigma factor RsiW
MNETKETTETSEPTPAVLQPKRVARRSFLRNLGLGAAVLVPGAALLGRFAKALAANGRQRLNAGDVAILID